jgi:DNA-binding response OmpR family regulator
MTRILVVEDDPAILRGLADSLRRESYDVLTAADGESALRLIEQKKPDLIILDLMLPRLSGYEVCRRMRSEGLNTPILMLTARGEEGDRVLGLDLGADDYVAKPFSHRANIPVDFRLPAYLRSSFAATDMKAATCCGKSFILSSC